MKTWVMGFLLVSFLAVELGAAVKLPPLFSDNMVVQRDLPLNVWGWAAPNEKVTVSLAGQTVAATADQAGRWAVKLTPLPVNKEPQELTVAGENQLSLKNVLVGDVWVCSGQSNMQMVVASTINAKEEIAASDNPLIRHLTIPVAISLYPKDAVTASPWLVAGPTVTGNFTAAGYYFARELVKETGVPIGLINTSWGGTRIEPWTPAEAFRTIPELKKISEQVDAWIPTTDLGKKCFGKYIEDMKTWIPAAEAALKEDRITPSIPPAPGATNNHTQPTMIFNSMINPLSHYGIKGALWYQGEANGGEGEIYTHKMRALISGWRSLWNQGEFPFYYVQLANFRTSNPDNAAGGEIWTPTREAQLKTMAVVPKTGMAVIIDIGEAADIHPKNKQDVGKRLAAWALAKDYGKKIVYSGPLYKDCKVEGNKIRISFEQVGGGLMVGKKDGLAPVKETPPDKLKWFALAGADKKWYWAEAVIDGETVLVSSEKVPQPAAVRYAFAMNPQGANLYNKEGFPASPFRTDNW